MSDKPYGDPAVTAPNDSLMNELMQLLCRVENGDWKARLQLIERLRELTGYGRAGHALAEGGKVAAAPEQGQRDDGLTVHPAIAPSLPNGEV